MNRRRALWIAAFALCVVAGFWLARSAAPEPMRRTGPEIVVPARVSPQAELPPRKFHRQIRPEKRSGKDGKALAAGAIANQRTLRFPDAAALENFLARAGAGVEVLGRLGGLNALRVRFADADDLAAALDGTDAEEGLIFPVFDPGIPEGSLQPGAVGLGDGLLSWLGVAGDNTGWGSGVKVAVLDSGVALHSTLSGNIGQVELVALPSDLATMSGHGTAVASVIAGSSPGAPGVAPGVDLLSVRIAGDDGLSDSFLLSQGIITAVDQGAQLINISMGSQGDSTLVKAAIAYAEKAGALIIAAGGNNGTEQVSYPAANDGVIAVGAVDALGDHLGFSNRGTQINLAAPGYAVSAASPDGGTLSATGTSFSAPIITGVLAAVMTEAAAGKSLTPAQAYEILAAYLNDTGTQGADASTGGGLPDLSRVFERGTPGINDAAIASSRLLEPSAFYPNGALEVLVQNRGTESLTNTSLQVGMGGGTSTAVISSLAPNEAKAVTFPVPRAPTANAAPLRVESRVSLPGGVPDAKPRNDASVRSYVAGGD